MPIAVQRMISGLSGPRWWAWASAWLLAAPMATGVAPPLAAAAPTVVASGTEGAGAPRRHHGTPDWGMATGVARHRTPASRVSGSGGGVDYRLDYRAGPVPTPAADDDPDPDPAPDLGSLDARLGWQLGAGQRFELSGALARGPAEMVSWTRGGAPRRERALEAAWVADWSGRYRTRVAVHGSRRQDGRGWGSRPDAEEQRGYALENRWKQGRHTWTADVRGNSGLLLQGGPGRDQEQDVVSLGHVYERNAQTLALKLAYLRDDTFGTHRSGGLSWDYALLPQWRVSAVAGSALDIPMPYSRTARPGAAARRPGADRRVELHLDWVHDTRAWGLAVYRRGHRELPSLAPADRCHGLAGCGGAARPTQTQGLTVSGRDEFGRMKLGGSLDLQQAMDADSGLLLPRHARQVLKLDGSARLGRWQVGPQWQLVGRRFADASQSTPLAGYGRVDLQASARFAPAWEFVVKVDNAADRRYRLSGSQVAAGRAWSVQLHWVPK